MVSVNQPLEGSRKDLAYFIFTDFVLYKILYTLTSSFIVLFHKLRPVFIQPSLVASLLGHRLWAVHHRRCLMALFLWVI